MKKNNVIICIIDTILVLALWYGIPGCPGIKDRLENDYVDIFPLGSFPIRRAK
jgi:hypothetical protein